MEADDRTQLTMLYENMYQFMISKDTDNLAKILSEEFALHHMTGMVQKKQEFLQAVKEQRMGRWYPHLPGNFCIDESGNRAELCLALKGYAII